MNFLKTRNNVDLLNWMHLGVTMNSQVEASYIPRFETKFTSKNLHLHT